MIKVVKEETLTRAQVIDELIEEDRHVNIEQTGTMKIGSRIIRYLSEGIYSTPAGSIKEIINNAFDADATKVEIITTDENIIMLDDGHGMDSKDFDEYFMFIGASIKRKGVRFTKKFNRPTIGFLGIGFISVSELCDKVRITSCKKNSDLFFVAEIDFSKYRTESSRETQFHEISDYRIINHKKNNYNIPIGSSFTKIELMNLLPEFREVIQDKKPFASGINNIKEIINYIATTKNYGITNMGTYWQMVMGLSIIIPVRYSDQGPVFNKTDANVENIINRMKLYNFSVYFDGIEIIKPFIFPLLPKIHEIHTFKDTLITSIGSISFTGYIYSQHGMMNPKEFNGIIIRVRNVAIGGIDRSLLNYPSGSNQLFRNWIFGEIFVIDGLENAMNINRNQFKITHPHYISLKEWLHKFLNEIVFKNARDNFYYKGRKTRQIKNEIKNQSYIKDIIESELGESYSTFWRDIPSHKAIFHSENNKEITINLSSPLIQKLSIKDQYLLERILVIFEISRIQSKGDSNICKDLFMDKLFEWIKPY